MQDGRSLMTVRARSEQHEGHAMKVKRIAFLTAPMAAAALMLTATAASASTGGVRHYASCSASGNDASCNWPVPARNIIRPRNIHAHITASPSQPVELSWITTCYTASGGSASNQGDVIFRTPPQRYRIRLPVHHPAYCWVIGWAGLAGTGTNPPGSGNVSVKITYRRR
jgi:hypothetical protein